MTQPCHADGGPQPQPQRLAGNQYFGLSVDGTTCSFLRDAERALQPPSCQRTPSWLRRCKAPRPASNRNFCPPASTRMLGPNRCMTGGGAPVPKSVTLISCPTAKAGARATRTIAVTAPKMLGTMGWSSILEPYYQYLEPRRTTVSAQTGNIHRTTASTAVRPPAEPSSRGSG